MNIPSDYWANFVSLDLGGYPHPADTCNSEADMSVFDDLVEAGDDTVVSIGTFLEVFAELPDLGIFL